MSPVIHWEPIKAQSLQLALKIQRWVRQGKLIKWTHILKWSIINSTNKEGIWWCPHSQKSIRVEMGRKCLRKIKSDFSEVCGCLPVEKRGGRRWSKQSSIIKGQGEMTVQRIESFISLETGGVWQQQEQEGQGQAGKFSALQNQGRVVTTRWPEGQLHFYYITFQQKAGHCIWRLLATI